MNIHYKQPQFELFPANSAAGDETNRPRIFLANLSLSMENLVILGILGIMLALFSFSLGVERGKRLAAQALDERVSAAWNVLPVKAAVPAKARALPVLTARMVGGNAGFVMHVPAPVAAVKPAVKMAAVKTAVPPKAAVIAPAAKAPRFTVQVATYRVKEYAMQEALNLKAKGVDALLIKKADFWLVCAGQLPTQEGAQALMKKLQSKYRGLSVRSY